VNSASLSAKSAGWGFRSVFTEFYRIRLIFLKTNGIGESQFFFVSAGFISTAHTPAGGNGSARRGIGSLPQNLLFLHRETRALR
jgi:hypothetical protein